LKQNLTLSLEKELILKAKVLSARRRTSVSKLLADELRRIVDQEEQYQLAKKKALADLREGFRMGGKITATRDELHDR
jgi:hypothetical protein